MDPTGVRYAIGTALAGLAVLAGGVLLLLYPGIYNIAAVEPHLGAVQLEDRGYAELLAQGDPGRGRALIEAFGCGACHTIPGVKRAIGKVGPPLTRFAERHFIAGAVLNNPWNLVVWIVNPKAIEPATAMPVLGVTPAEAFDIGAYLYTLGNPAAGAHPVLPHRDR